jgi:hypothetical protein
MKALFVFEYNEDVPNFSLTAVDSHRTAYGGKMEIKGFEITRFADIFYVQDKEDLQKFKKSGLDLSSFEPIHQMANNRSHFSDTVINEILDWADAKRAWVYKSVRMTGPERTLFEEFFKKLKWRYA